MANKYTHAKPATVRHVAGLRTRIRKIADFVTRERIYGADFPKFGAVLGVSYNTSTGAITKVNRASSVA